MSQHAVANDILYSRYADDISISGNQRRSILRAIGYASKVLRKAGLRLNDKKTRIASMGGQQKVTGVVVNVKPQPSRKFRRRVRAMFHQADCRPKDFKKRLPELQGYLSYLKSYPALVDGPELKEYRQVIERVRI